MTWPHGVNKDRPSAIKTLACGYGNWHKVYRLWPVLRVARKELPASAASLAAPQWHLFVTTDRSRFLTLSGRVFQQSKTGSQATPT
jgi:hypothetical protein